MRPNPVVIVDADDVRRNGIETLIQKSDLPFEVSATFREVKGCVEYLEANPVPFLLLDDVLSGGTNPERIVKQLHQQYPRLAIVVLSNRLNVSYIHELFAHGAAGYVDKLDRFADSLLQALQIVARGELYVSPRAARLIYTARPQVSTRNLSRRDLEVIRLMRDGLTVQEIATAIGISEQAVYRTRRKLREKLQVHTSEQIVAIAIERGLI
jgi:DNA-binding NarL/FixJ family response regulator